MSASDEVIGDRYRLVRRIGSGGMGVVWEAQDERLQRRVAVKVLHQQPGYSDEDRQLANSRAMREARIAARLHHRNAVPVFDVVDHHGQPCLVMQFVASIPLSSVLKQSGPLRPEEAAKVGAQTASALAAAHLAGIVHRDVKPGNILIADDGTALISDFGISHALGDATLTVTGMVHGTPAYLAPEVARGGDSSPASDVFSLGATLYAALEGSPPFGTDPNSIALLHRVAGGTFDAPKRSGAMAPLLVAMLAPRPEDRPAMAGVAQQFADLRGRAAGPPATAVDDDATRVRRTVAPPADDDQTPIAVRAAPSAAPTVVASATAARPAPTAAIPTPPSARARSRRPAVVVAAVLAAVVVVALLVWRLPADGPGDDAVPPVTSAPPTSPSAASSTPTPSTTPSPSPTTPSPTPSPTPSATPTPTPTPTTPSPSASTTAATATELAQAITDYYALMPDGTDEAWPRMTASYQSNTSGGRAAYERFWGAIESVSTSGVSGRPPGTATATVSYVYKDGRTSRERTTFELVRQDGFLKINSSRVG